MPAVEKSNRDKFKTIALLTVGGIAGSVVTQAITAKIASECGAVVSAWAASEAREIGYASDENKLTLIGFAAKQFGADMQFCQRNVFDYGWDQWKSLRAALNI